MRKTTFLFCLVGLFMFLTTSAKAQEPVSQSERRVVIKALETKIAELEVKRAVDLVETNPILIDKQLVNLRKRLAELVGKRPAAAAKRNPISTALVQNRRRPKVNN